MKYIYIVRTIDLKVKTEQDLRNGYEIFKINYPSWRTRTYEEYIDFMKNWDDDKYEISFEDNCYCGSYGTAFEKITNNECDINDGGVYDYASIVKIPLNRCYAESYVRKEDITLFKFNYEKDRYDEVGTENENEIIKWLRKSE